jgi:hypothetical protein
LANLPNSTAEMGNLEQEVKNVVEELEKLMDLWLDLWLDFWWVYLYLPLSCLFKLVKIICNFTNYKIQCLVN